MKRVTCLYLLTKLCIAFLCLLIMNAIACLTFLNIYSVGESGLVYKGYMDTPLGSELVAIKTGKGIKNYTQIDFH